MFSVDVKNFGGGAYDLSYIPPPEEHYFIHHHHLLAELSSFSAKFCLPVIFLLYIQCELSSLEG